MTDIRELFHDATARSAPPSVLTAEVLYASGQRRRRRRTLARGGAGMLAAVLIAVGSVAVANSDHRGFERGAGIGDASQRTRDGAVLSVAAGDLTHLYAIVASCPAGPQLCTQDLVGSDDGGRSWTMRSRDVRAERVLATAPEVVQLDGVSVRGPLPSSGSSAQPRLIEPGTVSVDGGRTWKDITVQTAAVAAVPAEGWIRYDCGGQPGQDYRQTCRMWVVDPQAGHIAPLANQPPGQYFVGRTARPNPNTLWISGTDEQSDERPVLAVSSDAGRTWSVHSFTDHPNAAPQSSESVYPTTLDGITGYVVLMSGSPRGGAHVYRTSDGGSTWQWVDRQGTAPWSYGAGNSFITKDGSHVIANVPSETVHTTSFSASRDNGNRYQPITLTGLPANPESSDAGPVHTIAGGGYLTRTVDAAYLSTDGLNWKRITP
ncbi:sialidase family protein [Dactylosporangium sp. NPDC049525]|uniref:sialidase family protein n=1 Tax=Dactylosporangium sp. NPDC049525 TaxID=3154730 RepID=UPI00341DB3F4